MRAVTADKRPDVDDRAKLPSMLIEGRVQMAGLATNVGSFLVVDQVGSSGRVVDNRQKINYENIYFQAHAIVHDVCMYAASWPTPAILLYTWWCTASMHTIIHCSHILMREFLYGCIT